MDQATIDCLRRTAPSLFVAGTAFTQSFYDRIIKENPSLKHIFNRNHQRDGSQPRSLFAALCDFVRYADNLTELGPMVETLASKHCACQIQAEYYPLVKKYLLETLKEKINPSEEVLAHWDKAIQFLSDVLIRREAEMYRMTSDSAKGGWEKLRKFKLDKKVIESDNVMSFILVPVDGKSVFEQLPGQYLTLHFPPSEATGDLTQIRHYSLSDVANGTSYRISVKRHPDGLISRHLHDNVRVGDIILATPPFGSFIFSAPRQQNSNFAKRVFGKAKTRMNQKKDSVAVKHVPGLVFISAGVGVTSLLPMLKSATEKSAEPILWIQADKDSRSLLFQSEVEKAVTDSVVPVERHVWIKEATKEDKLRVDANTTEKHFGDVELGYVFPENKNDCKQCRVYLCGSEAFMKEMASTLVKLGVDSDKIIYEAYGPLVTIFVKTIPVLPPIA